MKNLEATDVHYISENDKHITYLQLEENGNSDNPLFKLGIYTNEEHVKDSFIGLLIELSPEGLVELGKDLITLGSRHL